MSSLVTGEAVLLDIRTAALPSRLLAAAVDGLIQLALLLGVLLLISLFGGGGSETGLIALVTAGYVVVALGYPVMFETLMRGRTPGKAALGLRVVRDDAGPISFRQAFVRGLIGLVVERPGITQGAAAVISSLIDTRGRRLGDFAAGTMVIQERVVAPTVEMAAMPPQLASWATTLELSGLTDDLALSARSFLARSGALTDAARNDLGGRLTVAVSAVVSPPPPPDTPGWAYLSAVLAERRRREQARHEAAAGQPAAAWPSPPQASPAVVDRPTPAAPSGGFAPPG